MSKYDCPILKYEYEDIIPKCNRSICQICIFDKIINENIQEIFSRTLILSRMDGILQILLYPISCILNLDTFFTQCIFCKFFSKTISNNVPIPMYFLFVCNCIIYILVFYKKTLYIMFNCFLYLVLDHIYCLTIGMFSRLIRYQMFKQLPV